MNHAKWKALTPLERNFKVAKWDGWRNLEIYHPPLSMDDPDPRPPFIRGHFPLRHPQYRAGEDLWMEPPKYLDDLNAMHEAEKVFRKGGTHEILRSDYLENLSDICEVAGHFPEFADAEQRAEAFVLTMEADTGIR